MNEIERLKTVDVSAHVTEGISSLLSNLTYDKTPILWNVFCLLSNGYTIYGIVDHRKDIRELIAKVAVGDLEYLKVLIQLKRSHMGFALGMINKYGRHFQESTFYNVGYLGDAASDYKLYHGTGINVVKRHMVKYPDRFIQCWQYIDVETVDIEYC